MSETNEWTSAAPSEAGLRWFRGYTEPERIADCGPGGVLIGDQWRSRDDYEYGPPIPSPAELAALRAGMEALRDCTESMNRELNHKYRGRTFPAAQSEFDSEPLSIDLKKAISALSRYDAARGAR